MARCIRSLAPFAMALLMLACANPIYERPWIEVETPNFQISSAMSESKTVQLAIDLEWFRALVDRITNASQIRSPIPTHIIAFNRESEFRPFRDDASVKGYFHPGLRSNDVAIVNNRVIDTKRVILHEYVHFLLRNTTSIQYPTWYDEGFAEFLSTAVAHKDKIVIGAVPKDRISTFKYSALIPISKIISARSLGDLGRRDQDMFYAQSWALVHYLHLGRGGPKNVGPEIERYLEVVESGLDDDAAFEDAFGQSTTTMDRELRRYLEGGVKVAGLPVGALEFERPTPSVKRLPADVVATKLGQLSLLIGNSAGAQRLFESGVALNPLNARAQAGLGDAYKFQNQWDRAAPHFDRSLELDPEGALTQLDYAEYLHDKALREDMRDERSTLLRAARRHYVKSQKLDPEIPETYAMYGRTFLAAGEDASLGVDTIEHANGLLPSNVVALALLAEAYVATARMDDARQIVNRLIAWSHGGDRSSRVDEVLDEMVAKHGGGSETNDDE